MHRLLGALAERGFAAAPRVLSTDGSTETLTFVPGAAGTYPVSAVQRSEQALASVARTLRALHDATSDLALAGEWQARTVLPVDVDCFGHNDLGPYDVVFDGSEVVAFIVPHASRGRCPHGTSPGPRTASGTSATPPTASRRCPHRGRPSPSGGTRCPTRASGCGRSCTPTGSRSTSVTCSTCSSSGSPPSPRTSNSRCPGGTPPTTRTATSGTPTATTRTSPGSSATGRSGPPLSPVARAAGGPQLRATVRLVES